MHFDARVKLGCVLLSTVRQSLHGPGLPVALVFFLICRTKDGICAPHTWQASVLLPSYSLSLSYICLFLFSFFFFPFFF